MNANDLRELSLDEIDTVSGGGDPIVRDHCSFGAICSTVGNWQGQGGLGDFDTPAPDQSHQTNGGGQVNDHRTGH